MATKTKNRVTYVPRKNKETGDITLYKISYNDDQVYKLANTICVRCGYPRYYEEKIKHPARRKKYDFELTKHILSSTDCITELYTGKVTKLDTVYGYKYSCPELADGLYSLRRFDDIDDLGSREHYEKSIYELIDAINNEKIFPNKKEMINRAKEYLKTIKKDYYLSRNHKESFDKLYYGLKLLFDVKLSEITDQNIYVEEAKKIVSIEAKTYSQETIEDIETILKLTSRIYDRFE